MLNLILTAGFIALAARCHPCSSERVNALVHLRQFVPNQSLYIVDQKVRGNHTQEVCPIADQVSHRAIVEFVTSAEGRESDNDALCDGPPRRSRKHGTGADCRGKRDDENYCCVTDYLSCCMLSEECKPKYHVGFKYINCTDSPETHKIKFVFKSQQPGLYAIRIQSKTARPAYVVLLRTLRKRQPVSLCLPSNVHLGKKYGVCLLAYRDGKPSRRINAEKVLGSSVGSRPSDDFSLIFEQKGVMLLRQKQDAYCFDRRKWAKISPCSFEF